MTQTLSLTEALYPIYLRYSLVPGRQVDGCGDSAGPMTCYLPIRYVIMVLALLGCALDYLSRFSLSVAIVAMVNTSSTTSNNMPHACSAAVNASYNDNATMKAGEYDWSLQQQGIVLGTFFWGYFIAKGTGGRIAELVGARQTVGWCLALCGVLSMLCPAAAHLHPLVLAGLRFLMGLAQGPVFPALYTVLASWAPPDELATMVAVNYSGMGLGSLIALGLSPLVVQELGWRWVFWGGGLLTIAWAPFWFLIARNNPDKHFLISERERKLLSSIEARPKRRIPWGRIASCRVVYLMILSEMGGGFLQNFTSIQAPTFLVQQVGLSMKESGLVCIVLTGVGIIFCYIYGYLTDLIFRHQLLSKVNTRRLMHITGTLSGLTGLGNIGGFIAPIITSHLISQTNGWEVNILLTCGVFVTVGLLYVVGVIADVQDWNYYEEIPGHTEKPTLSVNTSVQHLGDDHTFSASSFQRFGAASS
ncbi:vesicular glutamate transporter 1 isoform X3 [Cherax quadricarinatus]|uniref:vesicular glutamate transporter 1 isoform X3 n=1 Tax=Cherax quadricarinatus TaxID=27406 RepID=UPI00387EA6EA